jgi:hypothetical protein
VLTGAFLVLVMVAGGLAYEVARTADAGVTKALYDLQWPVWVAIGPFAALLTLSTSGAALRTKLLPSWFCLLGIPAAIAFALGGTTWKATGFWSPRGAYAMIIEFLFLAWLLGASALLLARPAPSPELVARPATP